MRMNMTMSMRFSKNPTPGVFTRRHTVGAPNARAAQLYHLVREH